ncbi:MAG: peptidoglycan DD-metalloendopeptidase family protein [Deltaproteobacteria bacterium]|nr:peptidoglycan DD-metalloendopeptidase family protein [Deltaproteobacteria bacterium]
MLHSRSVRGMTFSIVGVLLMFVSGCATSGKVARGGWYVVKRGETIGGIAQRYHLTVQQLAEWNNIQNPDLIIPGRRLSLPPRQTSFLSPQRPKAKDWGGHGNQISTFHGKFAWPLQGPIHSHYGIRGGRRHDGIDIGAKNGAQIRAAAAGTVVFDRTLSGYGKVIIVRHPGGYYTAYAHNARHFVKKGEKVRQGEPIAAVGTTGRSSGPHLHFEIRRGQTARNPLFFLNPHAADAQRGHAVAARHVSPGPSKVAGRGPQEKRVSQSQWRKYVPPDKETVRVNTPFRKKRQ